MYDYSKKDIIEKLQEVGLKQGDSIFIHSNIGFFGKLENVTNKQEYWEIFKDAIFKVISKKGTIIVPTFTYSFCSKKIFDKFETLENMGILSELLRSDPDSKRSDDANFSVAAIGENSEFFTNNISHESFGKGSFWERFVEKNGKICNFNVGLYYNTFVHYIEKLHEASYRYDKKFEGTYKINNEMKKDFYIHFVRDLNDPGSLPDLTKLVNISQKLEFLKEVNLGRGKISCISVKNILEIVNKEIKIDPNFLIKKK